MLNRPARRPGSRRVCRLYVREPCQFSRSHGPPWQCGSHRSAVRGRAAALAIPRPVVRLGIASGVGLGALGVRRERSSAGYDARR